MIELRWYQKKATKLLFNYWRKKENKNKKPVIAIPTGAGKSLIIADIIYQAYSKYNIEILILSHRKEILIQNKSAAEQYLEEKGIDVEIGIYSAGLGERNKKHITIAGIQSCYRNTNLFNNVKLIIIDEAHLISPNDKGETMYQKFLNALPKAKCVGLTATPYRLGSGYIVGEGHIFDEIIFDLTSKSNFNRLVKEGYLTKLISKRTETELNAEGTQIIGGDYSEKELALKFDKENITKAAIAEIIRKASNYKKWLIFAINIEHAENIVEELNNYGIVSAPIHSKMEMDRKLLIDAFKQGKIQALVNVNILTVGIDVPDIDLIVFLRPTKSPVLYVQSGGRGLRTAPNKDHCLVLDFARIVQTLGPINDVHITKKKKGKKNGDPITKTCPMCDTLCHPTVKICEECGYEFIFKTNINSKSFNGDIVAETGKFKYKVDEIYYKKHSKINSPSSVKVSYRSGIRIFNEWICIEHTGWAHRMAVNWLQHRLNGENKIPENVNEILEITNKLKVPSEIIVKEEGKYPEIIDYIF